MMRPSVDLTVTTTDTEWLRAVARKGELSSWLRDSDPGRRDRARRALYAAVWPIVFDKVTRRMEFRRGHPRCAAGIPNLAAECLDRFHDDVEAVMDGVARRATASIATLEPWIASITDAAVVDGHRRRRGERGAQQRPRLPKWLLDALGPDPWIRELAVSVLVWVGVPGTAGTSTWPTDSWTERRARVTGDWDVGVETVAEEIETVLAAMRGRPKWYADNIERPLGHKETPTLGPRPDTDSPPPDLRLVDDADRIDAELRCVAARAIDAMEAELAAGADPRSCVRRLVHTLLDPDDALAMALLDDAGIDRLVADIPAALGR